MVRPVTCAASLNRVGPHWQNPPIFCILSIFPRKWAEEMTPKVPLLIPGLTLSSRGRRIFPSAQFFTSFSHHKNISLAKKDEKSLSGQGREEERKRKGRRERYLFVCEGRGAHSLFIPIPPKKHKKNFSRKNFYRALRSP